MNNKHSFFSASRNPAIELRPITEESEEGKEKLSTLHEYEEF